MALRVLAFIREKLQHLSFDYEVQALNVYS